MRAAWSARLHRRAPNAVEERRRGAAAKNFEVSGLIRPPPSSSPVASRPSALYEFPPVVVCVPSGEGLAGRHNWERDDLKTRGRGNVEIRIAPVVARLPWARAGLLSILALPHIRGGRVTQHRTRSVTASWWIRVSTTLMGTVLAVGVATSAAMAGCPKPPPPPGISGQLAYVTNSISDNVSVIDTATNTVAATINVGDSPTAVAVSPNGARAYVTNLGSDDVSVIDTATNTVLTTIGAGGAPTGVAVTPNGARAYVANSQSGDVSVIDTATNTLLTTIEVGPSTSPFAVATSPDGSRIYVSLTSGGEGASVAVIDTATNTVSATIGFGPAFGLAVTPDGSQLYVATTDTTDLNAVTVVNTATNTVSATIDTGANTAPFGVAVTPDGNRVYVSLSGSAGTGAVAVIDTATNAISTTINVGEVPLGVAVTPDGSHVYVANNDSGTVSVIDTATNTVSATIGVGGGPAGVAIAAVAMSPSPGLKAQVTSHTPVKVRRKPERKAIVIGSLSPGRIVTLECRLETGYGTEEKDGTWYRLAEKPRGWVQATQVRLLNPPASPCHAA